MKNIKNNKGLSLVEVIISMAISSVVLLMLTQMLSMNLQMKNKIQTDNILFNQSSNITTTIQNNMFALQAQKIELQENTDPDDLRQVIHITHTYDIVIDTVSGFVIQQDIVDPTPDILIFDPYEQEITYNGVALHSEHFVIDEGSIISVIPRDEDACDPDADPADSDCEGVMLKLDLQITYQRDLTDETTQIDFKQFISTIII